MNLQSVSRHRLLILLLHLNCIGERVIFGTHVRLAFIPLHLDILVVQLAPLVVLVHVVEVLQVLSYFHGVALFLDLLVEVLLRL